MAAIKRLTSTRPLGCYNKRDNPPIQRLVAGDGALTFDSDCTGDFSICLRDSFGALYAEGDLNGLNAPKTLSVSMYCRLLGRLGRFVGLPRFLHHVAQHDNVRICKRVDIAQFWKTTPPCTA